MVGNSPHTLGVVGIAGADLRNLLHEEMLVRTPTVLTLHTAPNMHFQFTDTNWLDLSTTITMRPTIARSWPRYGVEFSGKYDDVGYAYEASRRNYQPESDVQRWWKGCTPRVQSARYWLWMHTHFPAPRLEARSTQAPRSRKPALPFKKVRQARPVHFNQQLRQQQRKAQLVRRVKLKLP